MIVLVRVAVVPVSFLLLSGNQIKVFYIILRKCQNKDVLLPTLNKGGTVAVGYYSGYKVTTVLNIIKS